ncbi:hypothetical protein DID74_00345 [Candidatus Marinamargulisbacteria bacterium SCGC AG-333-B06]|nr:hypothetical protein DID74_00345 [Candidatus Marinamargulisbacteria bacterium SCGC AG-333-B06]
MTKIKEATQIKAPLIINDEIDIIELFKTLWRKKKFIILITSLCIIISSIYSFVTPKQYKATATFFITENEKPNNTIMGYASMLGVSSPSNISNLIQNVLESYSIKINIAKSFREKYKKKIDLAIQKKELPNEPNYINTFIIAQLKLNKQFSFTINKNNLYKLEYYSDSKILSKDILDSYLNQIILYNESLNLSAEKNILTIVDPPRIPLYNFKPNLKLNLLLGAIIGIFVSTLLIIIKLLFKK